MDVAALVAVLGFTMLFRLFGDRRRTDASSTALAEQRFPAAVS